MKMRMKMRNRRTVPDAIQRSRSSPGFAAYPHRTRAIVRCDTPTIAAAPPYQRLQILRHIGNEITSSALFDVLRCSSPSQAMAMTGRRGP